MRLYIAEKPSLGRAIAAVLPKPQKKHEGYIQLGNGDCVTWCIGHLLEQAEPESYDPRFKSWRLEDLPIVPDQWQWQAKSKTRKQLSAINKLTKQATEIVHAGDPDREGQLLVDLVLQHCKLAKAKAETVQRLLISDLNPAAVKKALAQLRSNREFIPLSTSALARSRADWLYGINLTRSFTIRGKQQGYQGILSVGRVQSPVLGLVVRRDQEIANFTPHDYYQVRAKLLTEAGESFSALWQPSEACAPHQDSEGRVINRKLAEHVVARTTDQPAQVEQLKQQEKQQAAPLPYNLSALQIDAAKRFAMPAKQVLDTCQALYERHQLITYPRSDCRYLPKQHHSEAPKVIEAIAASKPELEQGCRDADASKRGKAWNDSKVGAHHAIIPTSKRWPVAQLSQAEQRIYELIAKQYLAQFYSAYRYAQTDALIRVADGLFKASAKQPQDWGWKTLFGKSDDEQEASSFLPPLQQGQALHNQRSELLEKQTQPPKHFTDASLLAAITGIARYVQDPELKAVLKETDGLGTEATRAGIIDLLFKRQYLRRQGKQIHATESGVALVNALPEPCTLPDMTARWEMQLEAISSKTLSYGHFIQPMQQQLTELLSIPVAAGAFANLPAPKRSPFAKGKRRSSKRKAPAKAS